MKFQTYLFDFDGTLVDSMPIYASVMLRVLKENNVPFSPDILKEITPLGYRETVFYFQKIGLQLDEKETMAIIFKYLLDEYKNRIEPKKNVIETLRVLKEQHADLNILTASPHFLLDACLKRLGIYDLFTNVWSCEDFNTSKTNPEIYKMAAEKIGKPIEEILFLDDNLNADRAAKTSGIKVCGVYDKTSDDVIDEIKKTTDYFIYDFSELLAL